MGIIGVVDLLEHAGLMKGKFKSAELPGKKFNNGSNLGRRDENGVNTVDNAVSAKDVDGHQLAVEVDGRTSQSDADSQALLVAKLLGLEQSGNGVAVQDTVGRIEVRADMVQKDILEDLFRGVLSVIRNLLKSFVGRSKDSVVGLGTVESLNQVVVLVDQLCKLGSVFALIDELIYSPVGSVVAIMRSPMVRRAVVRRAMVRRRPVMRRPIMRWMMRWVFITTTEADGGIVER